MNEIYSYNKQKERIFTDEGQREFIKIRDNTFNCLNKSGAVRMDKAAFNVNSVSGDTWLLMAYVDRMVELKEIEEITDNKVVGQHRVFIKKE